MRRSLPIVTITSLFAVTLAACGGGGGGSTGGGGSVTPPIHTNIVTLHGGFYSGSSALSSARRATSSTFPMDVNLTALPPKGIFDVPDSYITNGNPDGIRAEAMYAYLTTSDGTMNGIPNPLPTPTLTQTGPTMSVTGIIPSANPLPTAPPVLIGGFNMAAPESDGHTVATISTTVNGTPMSASLDVYTYGGACVSSSIDNRGFNCATGLYWDASGVEHVTTDTSQADVYLQYNGDGTSTLIFPAGAVYLPNTAAYSVTSVPSVVAGPTSFSGMTLYNESAGGPGTFVFATRSGIHVKWGELSTWSGCVPVNGGCDQTQGLNTGDVGGKYGVYLATTGSTFAY